MTSRWQYSGGNQKRGTSATIQLATAAKHAMILVHLKRKQKLIVRGGKSLQFTAPHRQQAILPTNRRKENPKRESISVWSMAFTIASLAL